MDKNNKIEQKLNDIFEKINDIYRKIAEAFQKINLLERDVKWIRFIVGVFLVAILATIWNINSRIDSTNQGLYELIKDISINTRRAYLEETTETGNPKSITRIYLADENFNNKKDLYDLIKIKEFKDAIHADWNPKSNQLVFVSVEITETISGMKREGRMCIYDFDNNSLRKIKEVGHDIRSPIFSPSGEKIVYSTNHLDEYGKSRWDLAVISTKNWIIEPLTGKNKKEKFYNFDDNSLPHWSPDGKKIVFCADDTEDNKKPGDRGFVLFMIDMDERKRNEICDLGYVCHASFSPDGSFLIFQTLGGNPFQDIWLAPLENGKCISDESKKLDEFKKRFLKLEKIGNYYFLKLTNIGKREKFANGATDPFWINDEEIIYAFTDEFRKDVEKKQWWWDVNWTIKKRNIYANKPVDLLQEKGIYRYPKMRPKPKTESKSTE